MFFNVVVLSWSSTLILSNQPRMLDVFASNLRGSLHEIQVAMAPWS